MVFRGQNSLGNLGKCPKIVPKIALSLKITKIHPVHASQLLTNLDPEFKFSEKLGKTSFIVRKKFLAPGNFSVLTLTHVEAG
jgi:hypothetical protein